MPLSLVTGEAAEAALEDEPGRRPRAHHRRTQRRHRRRPSRRRRVRPAARRSSDGPRRSPAPSAASKGSAAPGRRRGRPSRSTCPSAPAGCAATTDQTNSVAFADDRYVLKLFRRIEPTPNPEFEIGRFLTERGFTRTPALAGALQYLRPGLEPGTLAVVQGLVKHQGSGWDYSIDELRQLLRADRTARAPALKARPSRRLPRSRDRRRSSRRSSIGISRARRRSDAGPRSCTARWRRAASRRSPRSRWIARALGVLGDGMRAHAGVSLDLLAQRLGTLNEASRAHAEVVLSHRKTLLSRFDEVRKVARTRACASASTATITSARCCAPRRTSSSSTSRASRRDRSPSGARSSRRSRTSPG